MARRLEGHFHDAGGPAKNRTALLIIDFTDAYLGESSGSTPRARKDDADRMTAVEYTRHLSEQLALVRPDIVQVWVSDNFIKPHHPDVFELGRDEICAHMPDFHIQDNHAVCIKKENNAMRGIIAEQGLTLPDYLHSKGITELLTCGTTITQCVRSTSLGALSHGFVPVLISECVTGGTSNKREAFADLQDEGIGLTNMGTVIRRFGLQPPETTPVPSNQEMPQGIRERFWSMMGYN